MPAPRTPLAKAAALGADAKNPQRYRDRREPKGDKVLGAPSRWLNDEMKGHWADFVSEVPWLKESDRGTVELVCHLRMRLHRDEITAAEIGHLRGCYGECGATPASKTKVGAPDGEDEGEDEFLN